MMSSLIGMRNSDNAADRDLVIINAPATGEIKRILVAEGVHVNQGAPVIEIAAENNKTRLRFTHLGLDPNIECFDSCSNSWTQIIQKSLYSLVTTGKFHKLDLG